MKPEKKYSDAIACPVCGKVFGEWARVTGETVIKKWCPKCKKFRYISNRLKKA